MWSKKPERKRKRPPEFFRARANDAVFDILTAVFIVALFSQHHLGFGDLFGRRVSSRKLSKGFGDIFGRKGFLFSGAFQ